MKQSKIYQKNILPAFILQEHQQQKYN